MGLLTLKQTFEALKPQARMHHVVTIVSIVIIAMLTLCYSILVRATLKFLYYHASMLTLHNLLNITCTVVATGVILARLECTIQNIGVLIRKVSN